MNEALRAQAMRYQSTFLAQLLKALPPGQFERLAAEHASGRKKRNLDAWGHLTAMVFAQASGARSLRDLERMVERQEGVMAHLGLKGLKRTTLSDANRGRPAALFEAVAALLASRLTGAGRKGREMGTVRNLVRGAFRGVIATPLLTFSSWPGQARA